MILESQIDFLFKFHKMKFRKLHHFCACEHKVAPTPFFGTRERRINGEQKCL